MGPTSPTPTINRPGDPGRRRLGELDNTLIIYISGDNGASAEACQRHGPTSSPLLRVPVPVKAQYLWYPVWGSDKTSAFCSRMGVGIDTPFKWVSRCLHFGGMSRAWPWSWPAISTTWAASVASSITSSTSPQPSSKQPAFPQPEMSTHQAESHRRAKHDVHLG